MEAVELNKGNVSAYICNSCGAYFEAKISHDYEYDEHWWVGKLRNRDSWDIRTNKIVESLMEIERKTGQGIAEYLGCYPIEQLERGF